MKDNFATNTETDIDLLQRKMVYLYNYFSSFAKLNENLFPSPAALSHNSLTNEEIQEEEYQHVLAPCLLAGLFEDDGSGV